LDNFFLVGGREFNSLHMYGYYKDFPYILPTIKPALYASFMREDYLSCSVSITPGSSKEPER
jgi:hypothetical protein